MFQFFPKDEKFFEMLERASANLNEGGKAFKDLLDNFCDVEMKVKRIKEIEHEGDIITHEIFDKLNRSFITPIDREDIHKITSELDDVLDYILGTADRLLLYKVNQPTLEARKMGDILLTSIEVLGKAISSLKDLKRPRRILDYCVEVNRLENEGDTVHKSVIADLFSNGKSAVEIIKWLELYLNIETAIDKCEDVADTIESIVVKNA